ncbi:hypothetical protein PM082_007018 [Marasmius tenuissimus]|nr:hypothetical protein PM082_007018 [Marasmius tenuissimus]
MRRDCATQPGAKLRIEETNGLGFRWVKLATAHSNTIASATLTVILFHSSTLPSSRKASFDSLGLLQPSSRAGGH